MTDSHVVRMIPLSQKSFTENPLISSASSLNSRETEDTLQNMLRKEVKTLKRREKLCNDIQVCTWVLFVMGVLSFISHFWYIGFYKCIFAIFSLYISPKYTRLSGFYLRMNDRNDVRVLVLALVSCLLFCSNGGLLAAIHLTECQFIISLPSLPCSELMYYTVFLCLTESVVLVVYAVFAFILRSNFKFKVGNYIEPVLVEIRDIKYILAAANSKSVKEQRSAALDLANMAASSVDNKFAVVAEGGLQVLINLALSEDEGVRSYAIEAISELLTIKSIQNEYVSIGGVDTLLFSLHSTDTHIVKESLLAICQLCTDNEEVLAHVVTDNGMDDLCHVVRNVCKVDCVRLVAGIFLDVSFSVELRSALLKHKKHVGVFERMVSCKDSITQQLSLQTLEMITLANPDSVTSHTSLIPPLLSCITYTGDNDSRRLSAKLLLYFVDNPETIDEVLLNLSELKESLFRLVGSSDNIMQLVASKVIFTLTQHSSELLVDPSTADLVRSLRVNAVDQESWMLSDKILEMMTTS